MSKQKNISELIDLMVLHTQNKELFEELTTNQKMVAAMKYWLGTTTRNGLIEFFQASNQFLFESVENGLKLINAEECLILFQKKMNLTKSTANDRLAIISELEHRIIFHDFEQIIDALTEYVDDNYKELETGLDIS